MSENNISGIIHKALCLLEDHVELGKLECKFEAEHGKARVSMLAVVFLCGISAFIFLHVALLSALGRVGIPIYVTCLILALGYTAAGVIIYRKHGQRDPRVGVPFQASAEEFNRSLQWIHQLFL